MNPDSPMKKHIKKIVYIMFENRSFDNLLAWLYDGQSDPDVNYVGLTDDSNGHEPTFHGLTPELLQRFAQPVKFKLFGHKMEPIIRGVASNWFPCVTPILDPFETFDHVTNQLYADALPEKKVTPSMLGFLQSYYDRTFLVPDLYTEILHTYDFHEAPILNTLAHEFAVSDLWFCSIPSQTAINRAYSICGNSVGLEKEESTTAIQMVNNHYWDDFFRPAQFTTPTIWEVLCNAGYNTDGDWRIYYSNIYLDGGFGRYKESYTYLLFRSLQDTLAQGIRSPFDSMYNTIDKFFDDVKAGDLPAFTYLEPHYSFDLLGEVGLHGTDYHPPSDIRSGEQVLREIYQALKEAGFLDETLLVVTFDEHGGTFDHIPPPYGAVNPRPDVRGEEEFCFNRYGVRVPTIFVSSWVTKNTVIRSDKTHVPFDHSSWLGTLLDWFDVDPTPLGARVCQAPKFDRVISVAQRQCADLPAPWDCRHESDSKEKKPLDIIKAVHVARTIASEHNVSPAGALRQLLEECKDERDLHEFYRRHKP